MGTAEALGGFQQDRFRDAVGIFANLAVPEPDDGPAFGLQELRAPGIPIGIQVLAPIQFDGQACLAAGQVSKIGPDW